MAIDLTNEGTPIDENNARFAPMLANLQGNILKGHGRDHTVHIFLELTGDIEQARQGLISIADRFVTSARQQRDETEQFKTWGIPGGLFGNMFLTANAYRKFGFTDDQIRAALPESAGDFGVASNFLEGMQAHGDELNDPAPENWDPGYQGGNIDVMILLADDDGRFLLRQARALVDELSSFANILVVERGDALRNAQGEGIEHFGYVDGRSQPIYFNTDLKGEGTTATWNPVEPLDRVLVKDGAVDDDDAFGSFFVFRKLEQNVRDFMVHEQAIADGLGLVGPDRDRAGAMAVGRFRDGTPLALSQVDGFAPPKENDFTYEVDTDGLRCPFHAHIRKANPRGDIPRKLAPGGDEKALERVRRITRRGITYGQRDQLPSTDVPVADLPTAGVGLLFMCFQANIANQFAFIQRIWVNDNDFVLAGTGQDAVIAQKAAGAAPLNQTWSHQWDVNDNDPLLTEFGNFVTLKGGEFFFAPSILFLKVLRA